LIGQWGEGKDFAGFRSTMQKKRGKKKLQTIRGIWRFETGGRRKLT